ncbi:MAG TPA: 6-phosphofructokinase [Bacilli bacterium]|jgi:6-phosphofructokinase 1|nr:6-phosphofructokinase [Bacilli bacterium]MDD3623843.1 6-phosphofructokinase [Bacilli bacterium]HNZ74221.1 6-phosphofructokinase [Bacilli bacterium]HOH59033.1 6-phosphofructokinase [Bacilli bacterium]HPA98750.1 6-phosphofructokinase [Bacilli bacterium]
MKRIAILTSGGDAPGMNAAIRAVVRACKIKNIRVYGVRNGFQGLLDEDIEELNRKSVSEKLSKGGTFLGTARVADFYKEEVQAKAADNLKRRGIDGLVTIGGDGTFRGALGLSKKGISVIAIPGTIDNDIEGTDFTIGFDTALQTAVEAVDKLKDTSSSHRRCSIVEVMGRECGDLAIWTGIASGAEFVVAKEVGYHIDDIIENVREAAEVKNHAIIIVAENMVDINELAKVISEKTPFSARTTILGHIQRGGTPTARDRVLASQMGAKAVDALLEGESGNAVCIRNNQIITVPIEDALRKDDSQALELYELLRELW